MRATLALARLLKARQPKLWDFCLRLRKKDAVLDEIASVAGPAFPACVGPVRPRARLHRRWSGHWHRTRRTRTRSSSGTLAQDPAELPGWTSPACASASSAAPKDLPEGVARLPIKTIHINKSPVVIANLKTLRSDMAQRWGLDMDQALRHADTAARHAGKLAGMWPQVFERPVAERATDVDEDLYGGFVGNEDRRTLQRLRG